MFEDENLSISIAVGTALLILTIIVGTVGAGPARMDDTAGALRVSGSWAAASLGQADTSAAYLTIENTGNTDDRLVAAAVEGVPHAELHMHIMQDGQTQMRPVDGIPLRAGRTTSLEPGGFHIMLIDVPETLEAGQTLPVTLTFERAEPITVEMTVRDRGYQGRADHDADTENHHEDAH